MHLPQNGTIGLDPWPHEPTTSNKQNKPHKLATGSTEQTAPHTHTRTQRRPKRDATTANSSRSMCAVATCNPSWEMQHPTRVALRSFGFPWLSRKERSHDTLKASKTVAPGFHPPQGFVQTPRKAQRMEHFVRVEPRAEVARPKVLGSTGLPRRAPVHRLQKTSRPKKQATNQLGNNGFWWVSQKWGRRQ